MEACLAELDDGVIAVLGTRHSHRNIRLSSVQGREALFSDKRDLNTGMVSPDGRDRLCQEHA
ncbi:hypothetical protein GCM10007919_30340 [Rhizobium indigoferae]|nr:hypothetical protein GCM10007919_30340 [Rhizobium indigoferae]